MRVELLDCPIDILTMEETVDVARRAMHERATVRHVAINVAKLVNMRFDAVLAADVKGSDLVGVDGMGIVWAARALGFGKIQRVAGVDLFFALMEVCERDGLRPFLLGATKEVADRAAQNIKERHPSLNFAGVRNGYFTGEDEKSVVEEIRQSRADCLFLGMPTPRKERFLAAYKDVLDVPFVMGIGGSMDIAAHHVRRAPRVLQQAGLEWAYRVYQEPRRMWWRYARTNAIFAFMLLEELLRPKSRPSNRQVASTK
jgi:N-acetylglucosaminyldiphosphoundecaprenol N-acetyl-beta-D-mannosaminyltransferase